MASSNDRSIIAPVAWPLTMEPLYESEVGAAGFTPPGCVSCWSPPSTVCACAGVVAPGALLVLLLTPGPCARADAPASNTAIAPVAAENLQANASFFLFAIASMVPAPWRDTANRSRIKILSKFGCGVPPEKCKKTEIDP